MCIRDRLQAVVQQCVNAANHSGTETGIFQWWEVFALNSSGFLEIVVEPLDLNGSQLVQGNISDSGDDVVLDVVGVVRLCVCLLYTSDVYKRQDMKSIGRTKA